MLNTDTRNRWMRFMIHILAICILLVLPDLLFTASRRHFTTTGDWAMSIYFKAVVYVFIFYVEYYIIIGRTLLNKKIWAFFVLSFLLILISVVVMHFGSTYFTPEKPPRLPDGPRVGDFMHNHRPDHSTLNNLMRQASMMLRDLALTVLVIALSVSLKLSENWSQLEKRHERLLASQKVDELENLKNQLNPHFLFNTLNTIYALIAISPEKAQDAVHELSTLLRYVLYENPEKVRLSQEIAFLRSYASLMQTRMGQGSIKLNFDPGPNPEVAPLLFIPLVENAFKHGNNGQGHKEPIEISVTADDQGQITCRTVNNFVPKPSADAPKKKGGIGLSNLKRRLELIYGKKAHLTSTTDGTTYTATLTIGI